MKTVARLLIYVCCCAAGVVCICQPFALVARNEGIVEMSVMLRWLASGFAFVWAGTEISERLKERWK